MVLNSNGVFGVRIARVSGNLTDHFNPKDNTIYLSDSVHDSTSSAAIGVAAHEAGHAVQHAEAYLPAQIRIAIVPVTNIGSKLSIPLIFIGLFFLSLSAPGISVSNLLFETISAFATVGLSTGITTSLNGGGKFILIFLMFAGKVGTLTLFSAVTSKKNNTKIEYPSANINVG